MNEISLIKALIDKDKVIVVHKPFVQMCSGSIHAAMMLNQLLYWSDGKTKVYGGWVAKTTQQWKEELCFSKDYEVKAARKILEDLGVVETTVKKFNGTPTVHYRLLSDKFLFLLSEQIGFGAGRQNDLVLDAKSITESTTENTSDTQPSSEKSPELLPLSIENQIFVGTKTVELPNNNLAMSASDRQPVMDSHGTKESIKESINKDINKKPDILDGMIYTANTKQASEMRAVEDILQTLEKELHVNYNRNSGSESVAKKILKEAKKGKTLEKWIAWVKQEDQWGISKGVYANINKVWAKYPLAFQQSTVSKMFSS